MGRMGNLGGAIAAEFFARMNAKYACVAEMRQNVIDIDNAPLQIHRPTMEYGQYQHVLVPFDQWPDVAAKWRETVGNMRVHLMDQLNNEPVSPDEGSNRPKTRCALLDAAIRKCFNSPEPIPFVIVVEEQMKDSPDAATHGIKLDWVHVTGNRPTFLTLTIICPFGAKLV